MVEVTFKPNKEQNDFIDFVFGPGFSWYWAKTLIGVPESKHSFMAHCTRNRLPNSDNGWGDKNSEHCDFVEGMFLQICASNNIYPKTIHRSCLNLTTYAPEEHSHVHVDHPFPHQNFILYLNDFSGGATYVFEEDKKTLRYKSTPARNKAFIFPGAPHAQGFCAPNERRVILVVTFS